MTPLDLRLAFRLNRFEILGFGVLIALLTMGAVYVASELDATGYGARCTAELTLGQAGGPGCDAAGKTFYEIQQGQGNMVQGLLQVVPFLLGALVGAPLVARELERGTARLAWSLAPSRTRWLVTRLVPGVVVVFGLSFVAGAALDRLLAATEPQIDVGNAFAAFGGRGVILAARVTFVFAIGVTVGALVGRALPALILTAVVAWIAIAGGSYVHQRILRSEAVLIPTGAANARAGSPSHLGDLFVDQRVKTPDGRVVTWEELNVLYPPPTDAEMQAGAVWPPEGTTTIDLAVPGTRYHEAEAREVAALGGASLAFLGVGGLVIRRRRPG